MKIALIHNWPGQRNSELELIKRISIIISTLGHQSIIIDPLGHPLSEEGEHQDFVEFIDPYQYDFSLSLHYVNPHIIDLFSYAVNWNPLNYVVRNPMDNTELSMDDIAYRTTCLSSHDAILSAGSLEMDNFVASLNIVKKTQIFGNKLYLHTSMAVREEIQFPNFDQFKLFYIGANWERQQGEKRHDGLIELLDETNLIDFYGVKKQHGVALWEGVQNYRGELPFDGGSSIIKQSNKCGVSLVLHSKAHNNSGLVSTRIFQACAAKTLTICDENPFILKNFGDSVLYFKSCDDPEENVRKILEKVEWINTHPVEALKKAKRAHEIFSGKFCLKKEITNLLENHKDNVDHYHRELGACNSSASIDVLYFYRGGDLYDLTAFYTNLEAQNNICPRAVVFTMPYYFKDIQKYSEKFKFDISIIKWSCKEDEVLPLDGRLIANYLENFVKSPCFTVYSPRIIWNRNHLTQLHRGLEGKEAIVITGTFVKNETFQKLTNDYTAIAMSSLNTHPHGVTEHDISSFNAGRFPQSSFLFASSAFKNKVLLKTVCFFDAGWSFLFVLWYYLNKSCLPVFIPKLTVTFIRDDNEWLVDSYKDSSQTESYERSLAYAFFKNDPNYASLKERSFLGDVAATSKFSINIYMNNALASRPILLKVYKKFFKVARFFMGLPNKEV